MVVAGGWAGWGGKQEDVGQRVQTSSCKMKMFWGCDVQHGDYNYNIVSYT